MITNGERLMKLETQMDDVKDSLKNIGVKLDKFIECADLKFADKKIENDFKEYKAQDDRRYTEMKITLAKYAAGIAVILFIVQILISSGIINNIIK